MKAKSLPSTEYLNDPENGKLFWKHRPQEHFGNRRGWLRFNATYAGRIVVTMINQTIRHLYSHDGINDPLGIKSSRRSVYGKPQADGNFVSVGLVLFAASYGPTTAG